MSCSGEVPDSQLWKVSSLQITALSAMRPAFPRHCSSPESSAGEVRVSGQQSLAHINKGEEEGADALGQSWHSPDHRSSFNSACSCNAEITGRSGNTTPVIIKPLPTDVRMQQSSPITTLRLYFRPFKQSS